jgi:hypothetical protein
MTGAAPTQRRARRLLHAALQPWLRDARDRLAEGCPAHGVSSNEATRSVVVETLRETILPGFEPLGVATKNGLEWCKVQGLA